MTTTISSFAAIVQRDYGTAIALQFSLHFAGANEEISFGDAMCILDSILNDAPAVPTLRTVATISIPGEVMLG